MSDFTEDELVQTLRFAARHAQRVGGVERPVARSGEEASAVSWRWEPGSPTVELSPALATGRGAQVQLVISDDGPGVPPEHRERIFDRFIRLDDARTREDGGSGLGLAICREIVTAHSGRIWADEARGGGAKFVVQIPAD